MAIEPWKLLKEVLVFNGRRKIVKRTYKLQTGRVTDFEIRVEAPAANIFPLTKNNTVLMTKQFRPGGDLIMLELPGGRVEEGQTHEEAATVELLEETGYKGKLHYLGGIRRDAWSNHIKHCYVATECEKLQEQKLGPNESIEIVEVPLSEYREMLKKGAVRDVDTGYMALDYLNLL